MVNNFEKEHWFSEYHVSFTPWGGQWSLSIRSPLHIPSYPTSLDESMV